MDPRPLESDNHDFRSVRTESRPPQFSLRGLFLVMTSLAVLFAVIGSIGATRSVALVFLLLLIAAHVIGNAIATRLRDRTTRALTSRRRDDHP